MQKLKNLLKKTMKKIKLLLALTALALTAILTGTTLYIWLYIFACITGYNLVQLSNSVTNIRRVNKEIHS